MAKAVYKGISEYSNQSFGDILNALQRMQTITKSAIDDIEANLAIVRAGGYWQQNVRYNFRLIVEYALEHYYTTETELKSICEEIPEKVQKQHCKRLDRLAHVGQKINVDIGLEWNNAYEDKDYDNKIFTAVERIYNDTRDMSVTLGRLASIKDRLTDFVGQKKKMAQKKTLDKKLKILLLTASPASSVRLRVDVEARKIDEAIRSGKLRDGIELINKSAVMPGTFSQAMLESEPDIVHFSGHGKVDGILLENDSGHEVLFPASGLQMLFRVFVKTTKAVILNACYSEEQAIAISALGIWVIGMADSIDDDAAIMFSTGFYQAIGAGRDVPSAFIVGMALMTQVPGQADVPVLWKDGARMQP